MSQFKTDEKFLSVFKQDTFRWGFSSLGSPDLNIFETLELAIKYGLELVELRTLSGVVDILDELETFVDNNSLLVEDIKNSNFVVGLNLSCTLVNSNDKTFEQLLTYGRIADKLNCKYLRVFGGFDFEDELTMDYLEQSKATIEKFYELKAANNLKCDIALEIHDGYSSTDRILQLFDYCQAGIPIIWDSHHSYIIADEEIEYTWNALKDFIVHVHIKDSKVTNANGIKTIKGCLPGEGDMVGKEVIELLRANGFNGTVSLEWEKFWEKDLPKLEYAIDSLVKNNWV